LKIKISDAAFNDIYRAINWYNTKRYGLGYDFKLCFDVSLDDILFNPEGYQKRYKLIRIKYMNRFPYGIHFFIERKIIFVIGVFHTSESPLKWSKRKIKG